MSDYTYLDTSALLRWAFHKAGSPKPRDAAGHTCVESLVSGDTDLALSSVTLIEFSSNINSKVRAQDDWYVGFTEADAEAAQVSLMGLIRSGRVVGRNLGPRSFEMAMMYVDQATKLASAKLLAWDALHLVEAVRWSLEVVDVVAIATSDSDFARFLQVLPELAAHVSVLDVTANAEVT